MRWPTPLVVALALFAVASCDQNLVEPAPDQAAGTPTLKAEQISDTYDYDLDWDLPYPDCLGEPMQNHGVVKVYFRETTTPSGNVLVHGWVDYQAYGEVTLEGLWSEDVYTLRNAKNPFTEVIKDNGFYLLHYHWNELYRSDDGKKVNLHLRGHVKVEPDGTVRIDRESYRCN